jgi:hypothetical protein
MRKFLSLTARNQIQALDVVVGDRVRIPNNIHKDEVALTFTRVNVEKVTRHKSCVTFAFTDEFGHCSVICVKNNTKIAISRRSSCQPRRPQTQLS